MYKLQTSTKY